MNRVKEEIHMKEYIKSSRKFLLFVLCSGLIGGYCLGLYIPEMYSQEMLQQLQEQGMTTEMLVLIISKMFCKNEKEIPVRVLVAANIISALLFAAGHLPGTMAMTTLTPLLLFRCFLFNGGLGLCFGWLYRKYGIGYAMIAHGFAHLISDLLMVIF